VCELWERGREHFPEFHISLDDFAEFAQRLDMPKGAARKHLDVAPDLYLACGCMEGISRALAAFEEQILSQVPQFLKRYQPDEATLAEVKQLVRERLFLSRDGGPGKIAEYAGLGPLGAWTRVVTVRVALGLFAQRQQAPIVPQRLELETLSDGNDLELRYLQSQHREQFRLALSQAVASLSSEQRNLLRLHLFDGLSIDKLGALFKVHRTTVARWLKAAREQVLTETRRRLLEALKLSSSEVDSLVRVLQSQLDLSLSRLFAESSSSP
jgi:RNA polymerase sigma-70 factor (ECF subfamily)